MTSLAVKIFSMSVVVGAVASQGGCQSTDPLIHRSLAAPAQVPVSSRVQSGAYKRGAYKWHAQWIGADSATSDLAHPNSSKPGLAKPDLSRAQWIWHDAPGVDLLKAAPGGPAFLRRSVTLPENARIRDAVILITADDSFTLWVNGQQATQGNSWEKVRKVNIKSLLRPGLNVLAVEAVNNAPSGSISAAGLIAALQIVLESSARPAVVDVVTDGTWKTASSAAEGWKEEDRKENGAFAANWSNARVVAPANGGPWSAITGRDITSSAANSDSPEQNRKSNVWSCFRKTFSLSAKPASALARIAVDSKYWLWVNGRMLVFEGGLKRGPNPTDTYFDQIDLAPYLKTGKNTVAVLAWYFGKDGFSHKSSGQAGFLFEMNAGRQIFCSDSTWKALPHPAYRDTEGEQPNSRLSESNVRFDGRLDIGDWTAASYDDSRWGPPALLAAAGQGAWHDLQPRPIPQWKDYGLKEYLNAGELPKVSTGQPIVARMPHNAQVTPWLQVEAPGGQTIDIRTDNYNGGGDRNVRGEYVTRAGVQSYESLGWMNGEAVIYNIPKGVKILQLKYRETGYDTGFQGSFACDDPFYNKLWEKSRRTLYITMRDNYMDCPDRERAQWWGDAVNELGEAFYALSPSSSQLARKAIRELCAWQRADKVLFSPVPSAGWNKELTQQMLASVGKYGFWTYYFYSGDKQTAVEAYPHVRDYLSLWQLDGQGLVVHRSGDWDWADWGDNIDTRLLDQAWYCLALEGAASLARLAGKPGEADAYLKQRSLVVDATNKEYWKGSVYRSPDYRGADDDRGNALCVVAGIAGRDKFAAVQRVLETQYHASPYMEKYVLEALALMGKPDIALARMKNRYGDIVANEWTTLPELWLSGGQLPRSSTRNHAWSGGPLTILSQYIAGISPLSPAYATYELRPQLGSLHDVSASAQTPRGKIAVALRQTPQAFRLELDSPRGTTASVCIPATKMPQSIWANGKQIWTAQGDIRGSKSVALKSVALKSVALKSVALKTGALKTGALKGVAFKNREDNFIRFTVAPGQWKFEARYQ
jgi:hypothetical protein